VDHLPHAEALRAVGEEVARLLAEPPPPPEPPPFPRGAQLGRSGRHLVARWGRLLVTHLALDEERLRLERPLRPALELDVDDVADVALSGGMSPYLQLVRRSGERLALVEAAGPPGQLRFAEQLCSALREVLGLDKPER
jgi:hypothetical protein